MRFLRRAIQYTSPELVVEGSRWAAEWRRIEREKFARVSRVFFACAAAGYLAHHFIFDTPNQLEPAWAWLSFRIVAASLCLMCFWFYGGRHEHWRHYKAPAAIVMALGCFSQALVTYFYADAPWIYPFAFLFGGVLILQASPAKSLAFSIPVCVSFFPPLLAAGVPFNALVSASVFFCLVSALARVAYFFEIQAFVREQERDESRQEVIQLGKEFEARLKSFIPRVIAGRIEARLLSGGMTPIEASLEVLRPKRMVVSCLFSDIRGFTQGSREIESFLLESVIPEVKACSDAVEEHGGIPRKIGDLIFAYFDDDAAHVNVLRALQAGIKLSRLNEDLNATVSSVAVKRYILIATGEAIVGNVGGVNSGVEITALGPPVNFLSRLDDATKSPELAELLSPGDLVLCARSAEILRTLGACVILEQVDLRSIHVAIRDFPEVDSVYILRPSRKNESELNKAVKVCSAVGIQTS